MLSSASNMSEEPSKDNSPDLSNHLSREAQERLPNAMKVFFRSLEEAPALVSLANGDPHASLYPLAQVDFHVPALSTLGSMSSWIDRSAPTQTLSVFKGNGQSAIDLSVAMQYGTGLGLTAVREQLAELNKRLHCVPHIATRNITLTLGNADAVTKIYRLLGTPGDTFLAEEYSFCGLTNAPFAQGVRWQPIKIDSKGLIPQHMEEVLSTWDETVRGRRPHMLYCIPTGQNPTGATLPLERRRDIYAIAQKYDIVILEDDPYYFFQYAQDISSQPQMSVASDVTPDTISVFLKSLVPSFLSLDTDGRVIRVDTFSKTIAPNMRLGWVTSNALFSRKLEILTDNSTQHPHGLGQSFVAELLSPSGWGMDGYLRWVSELTNEYQRRRDFFFQVFQRELGTWGHASTKPPVAGMFFWVKVHIEGHPRYVVTNPAPRTGPKTNSAELMDELFKLCFKEGLLVMPGVTFAMQPTDGSVAEKVSSENHILDQTFFRTTFVGTDETIEKALIIFGKVVNQFFKG